MTTWSELGQHPPIQDLFDAYSIFVSANYDVTLNLSYFERLREFINKMLRASIKVEFTQPLTNRT